MITPNEARLMAMRAIHAQQLGRLDLADCPSPLSALRRFPWTIPEGLGADQTGMAQANLALDGIYCLGRVAQGAAFMADHFPGARLGYAEVLEDYLRNQTLQEMRSEPPPDRRYDWYDDWLRELLMYEEPHAVLLVDGEQFDPLSTVLDTEVVHPRVQEYPLWEGIASAMTVSKAWLEKNPWDKWRLLEDAEHICPGTTLVVENKVGFLASLDRGKEAVPLLRNLVLRRPCARTLLALWALTGDESFREHIDREYGSYMIDVMLEEVEDAVRK